MIVIPSFEIPVFATVFDELETWGEGYRRSLTKDKGVLAIMLKTTTDKDYERILSERGDEYVRDYADTASSITNGLKYGWVDELHITEQAMRSLAGGMVSQTAYEYGVHIVEIPTDLTQGIDLRGVAA